MDTMNKRRSWIGAALWLFLLTPPLRHYLQSTMTLQMLAQLPLLAVSGWLLRPLVPVRIADWLAPWDRSGVTGLVLVSVTSMIWMLPVALDASVESTSVEFAKFFSVALLVGLPFSLSWPRAGFVVRGMFLIEAAATAIRLGWLYVASPQRLCANYLLDDQQKLGKLLFAAGILLGLILLWKLIFGHIRVGGASRHRLP